MTANFANEPSQPIRLTLSIGGQLRPLRLTGTVWGAHTRPGGVRAGRATHGGREYPVTWSAAEGAWLFVETPMQYDPNEVGE